jgi:hypothetical protein
MTVVAIVLAVWLPALVAGVAWSWTRHRPLQYADRVVVSLTTGNAIEGTLVRNRGGYLTLAEAAVVIPEGEGPVALEGRVVIPAGGVTYLSKTWVATAGRAA